ncbi:hypothetical protein [Campylobacter fetus]|nr:hypothetical protein [Campylobacter fetus]
MLEVTFPPDIVTWLFVALVALPPPIVGTLIVPPDIITKFSEAT